MKTRTGLRNLLNVKTLNSLYLNKRCYSSRCKLRSAKEVIRSLGVLCPCPPHPTPSSVLQCGPYPTPTPLALLCLCNSPASLHSAFSKCCCGAGLEGWEGTEQNSSETPVKCTFVNGIPTHQRTQSRARPLQYCGSLLGCTLQTLQKSPSIPYYSS